MQGRTDTAHQTWDNTWSTSEGRAGWLEADPFVAECATRLKDEGAKRALDVGCGVGRHSLLLAGLGFETSVIDGSQAGLNQMLSAATAAGLHIDAHQALMTELPFGDGTFDYVLSFNVLYHGDEAVVRKAYGEIARVLKPGGTYQGTMLSKRHRLYGIGQEISPNAFVIPDAQDDKIHPHYYCNAAELIGLIAPLDVVTLFDKEQNKPGNWHWHVTAQKHA